MEALKSQNGETVEIDKVIEALEKSPSKAEVMEALRGLRQDKIKGALGETVKAARFDLGKVFGDFLIDGEKAEKTKQTYRVEFKRFEAWLDREDLHVLRLRRADVNRFKSYMAGRYSANTVRLSLAACSSFWKYMEAEGYIDYQPFSQIKYPRKQYKKAVRPDQGSPVPVMNGSEYQSIIESLEQKAEIPGPRACDQASRGSARRLLPLVHFLSTYGLRIGDVLTVRIEEGGRFSYRQKGGLIRQKALKSITVDIIEKAGLRRQPFKDIAKVTVQGALRRLTVELATRGVIRHAYSCHDFRHLYAVSLYRETGDIYAVKEALGHATVSITEIYLAGLGALGQGGRIKG